MRRIVAAVVALLIVAIGLVVAVTGADASPLPAPTPTRSTSTTLAPGGDGSWPTCKAPSWSGKKLPLATAPSFVVIGVNDGEPGTTSACIAHELAWATTATGGTTQPKLAYYVMGADPWQPTERRWTTPVWPTTNRLHGVTVHIPAAYHPAGGRAVCKGGHTNPACAYLFGWNAAYRDAHIATIVHAATTRYWLDVEEPDDWNTSKLFNQAVIEGMAAYFTTSKAHGGLGSTTGIYSDAQYWQQIVGTVRTGSPLKGLDLWLTIGAATKAKATTALTTAKPWLAGSRIRIVQYWGSDLVDRDVAAAKP